MRVLMSILMCLSLSTIANAQWVINHPSTVGGSYLTGAARFLVGRGYVMESYGDYLIDREIARRYYIENWANSVQTRWAIRDEWIDRNKTINHLDRKEKLLDQAERAYALRLREQALRESGVLPPSNPEAGSIGFNGKRFRSLEEFKNSPEYYDMLINRDLREIDRSVDELLRQERLRQAIEFGRVWSRMSEADKFRYRNLNPDQRYRYIQIKKRILTVK